MKYVIYIRVSTQRQGRSGLGLEAQREICLNYIRSVNGELSGEYKDVESGTHRNRKGLWDAIDFCRSNKCTLVVAKLDRLARDIEFTFKVINSGIDIYFCDMPVVNTMVLGVFAAVAQYERELISKRTKDALAAKKARLEVLGNSKGIDTSKATAASATARREAAQCKQENRIIWGVLTQNGTGTPTTDDFMRMSATLNNMGVKTSTGLDFTPARARSAYHNLKRIYC